MCLAIPGLVEEIFADENIPVAVVNFSGIKRRICMSYVPDVKVGEYVLVHVGFALTVVDEEEAKATLEALERSK